MQLQFVLQLLSICVLTVGVHLSGWAGLLIVNEEGVALRLLVAACLFAGAFIAVANAFLDNRLRCLTTVLICAVVMLLTQLVALTLGAPGLRIDVGVLGAHMLQQTLLVGWIIFCFTCDWRNPWLWRTLVGMSHLSLGANLLYWIVEGCPTAFAGFGTGKNGLAALTVLTLFWGVAGYGLFSNSLDRLFALGLIPLSILTLFASGGRASMLLIVACVLAFPLLNFIRRRPGWQAAAFLGLIAMHAAIPQIYTNIDRYPIFHTVDRLMQRYTHSLYSGRQELWPQVIARIEQRPWMGHGTAESWRMIRKKHGIARNCRLIICGWRFFLKRAWSACWVWSPSYGQYGIPYSTVRNHGC
jgi:O-antigen ligase